MNRMESFELLGECVPNMMIWLENPFRAMWVGTHYFKTVTPWSIVFYVLTGTLINLVPTPLLRHVMWKKHINSTKAAVFHVSTCDISESHLARPSVLTLTVAAVHIWAEKQRGNIRFESDTSGSGTCTGAGACSCYRESMQRKGIHAYMSDADSEVQWENMQWKQTAEVKTAPQDILYRIHNSWEKGSVLVV